MQCTNLLVLNSQTKWGLKRGHWVLNFLLHRLFLLFLLQGLTIQQQIWDFLRQVSSCRCPSSYLLVVIVSEFHRFWSLWVWKEGKYAWELGHHHLFHQATTCYHKLSWLWWSLDSWELGMYNIWPQSSFHSINFFGGYFWVLGHHKIKLLWL